MGVSLGWAECPPVRLLRRTVAQSTANRNGGSALNLNEGVIAAPFVPREARPSAPRRRSGGGRRPIDKGSTPSYLSGNSPVSVGRMRLAAACPEPDMLLTYWVTHVSFRRTGSHFADNALPEKHPTPIASGPVPAPGRRPCDLTAGLGTRIRHVWRCSPKALWLRERSAHPLLSAARRRDQRA